MLDDIRKPEAERTELIVEPIKDVKGYYTGHLHKGELIRCKDCVHWQDSKSFCKQFHLGTPSDGFCYMAKRKTTGTDCSWK